VLTYRQVFDTLDGKVSAATVRAVNTPEVAAALLTSSRYGHAALTQLGELRSALAHLWSLPSHHDVRDLQHQVAALRVQLAEVQAQLEDLKDDPR
jgi:hypothetical protein